MDRDLGSNSGYTAHGRYVSMSNCMDGRDQEQQHHKQSQRTAAPPPLPPRQPQCQLQPAKRKPSSYGQQTLRDDVDTLVKDSQDELQRALLASQQIQNDYDLQMRRAKEESARLQREQAERGTWANQRTALSLGEHEESLNVAIQEIDGLSLQNQELTRNRDDIKTTTNVADNSGAVPPPIPPRIPQKMEAGSSSTPAARLPPLPPRPSGVSAPVSIDIAVPSASPDVAGPAHTTRHDHTHRSPVGRESLYQGQAPTLTAQMVQPPRTQIEDLAPFSEVVSNQDATVGQLPASSSIARCKTPSHHPYGLTPTTECVDSLVTFGLEWFTHPAVPTFTICSRCYVDHIYDSPFRDAFIASYVDDGQARACMFGKTRFRDIVWQEALQARRLDGAVDLMMKRATLGHCNGQNATKDRQWYTTPDIPGLSICAACYEDEVMANLAFGRHFTVQVMPGDYICDLSVPYIQRVHAEASKLNDWHTFVSKSKNRLGILPCPKSSFHDTREWFVSRRGPDGFHVCTACYYDYFLNTPNATYMELVKGEAEGCASESFNILISLQAIVSLEDWPSLWRVMDSIHSLPRCHAGGTTGVSWFTVRNDPSDDFAICEACVKGIIEPMGVGRYFITKPGSSAQDLRLCCFNPARPRAMTFLQRLVESKYKGTWNPLGAYAALFASVPLCPRDRMREGENKRYWGWDDVQICEECYLSFARGKEIEPQFTRHGELVSDSTICDMYSQRMRKIFLEACSKRDTSELLAYGTHRRQVFVQTVPICERLLMQSRMAANQAQMLGFMGSTYKAMGGAIDATQGHAYLVGNSTLGWHGNSQMFQGAVYDAQSSQVAAQVSGPMMQIKVLEEKWRSVE